MGPLILLLGLTGWAADPGPGFRGDGTAVYEDAAGSVATLAEEWRTPLPGWSNGSIVTTEGLVLVMQEPTTLVALEPSSGAVLWTRTHDAADASTGEDAARIAAGTEAARKAQRSLDKATSRYASIRREMRRTGADVSALAEELERLGGEMRVHEATVNEWAWATTPADKGMIGYSSATPVIGPLGIYAVFGNGVVGLTGRDGRPRWTRHLGAAPRTMRGWDWGTSASPVLVGETLVVSYGELRGLHPATGETLWSAGQYQDFGTPAVAHVDGGSVLVLPDGRVIDVASGAELARDLPSTWFVGPAAHGSTVLIAGGQAEGVNAKNGGFTAARVALERTSVGLTAKRLWERKIAIGEGVYATPLLTEAWAIVVTTSGKITILEASTGQVVSEVDVSSRLGNGAKVMASPILVGTDLWVMSDLGDLVQVSLGPNPAIVGHKTVEPARSTPFVVGEHLYIRGLVHAIRMRL